MPTELLSRDLLHTRDAIGLPPRGEPVVGHAERIDRYPIAVTRSISETLERLLELVGGARLAVIADRHALSLHGPALLGALAGAGIEPDVVAVPAGERHKTLEQAARLLDWLTGTQLTRRDVILTFGGGVVIDLGGWVASLYGKLDVSDRAAAVAQAMRRGLLE